MFEDSLLTSRDMYIILVSQVVMHYSVFSYIWLRNCLRDVMDQKCTCFFVNWTVCCRFYYVFQIFHFFVAAGSSSLSPSISPSPSGSLSQSPSVSTSQNVSRSPSPCMVLIWLILNRGFINQFMECSFLEHSFFQFSWWLVHTQ